MRREQLKPRTLDSDALDRARDAAIRASTIYPGFDAPAPNDGAPVFGEMGVLGQRPGLAEVPNNPLSRRVNVADPGLKTSHR